MPTRLNAYDPETGAIVWSCDGLRGRKGDLVYTSPILAGDVCVAMGGFNGPAIGLSMDGSGNVTGSHRLWRVEPNPQRIGSGVCVDGHVYMASAGPSTFQCLAPKTGELLWEADSEGAVHWGSLVFAAGRLYVTDQAGTTHVMLPNPEKLELVAHNPLGERSNSTPAFSDGEIFIRTFEGLYCISKSRR
jgi:outer membrane protein assembly factor BamB